MSARRPQLELLAIDFPGARLASRDEEFDYRIYRLDRPMMPGETRELAFRAGASRSASATRRRHAAGAQRHLPQQFRAGAGDRHGPLHLAPGPRDAAQIRLPPSCAGRGSRI
jgi:hypothetical protein